MKQVTVAKSAGFCFGVKRAVDTVYEQIAKENGRIYTYGPIIHNEEVVKDLEAKGVTVIEEGASLTDYERGTVIIRSHGVAEEIYTGLKEQGFEVVDATCPFVLKIHRYVREYSEKDYHIVIIGNPTHPEVEGIRGWCDPKRTTVLQSEEEAGKLALKPGEKVCVVSQTTFNYNKFQDLVEIIKKKGYDIIVLNTICNATEERQSEAARLARESDAMIVIGGKSSSNTQKLFEICKNECENTYYIQTLRDLKLDKLQSIDNVGITAGASTPNKIIEEVQTNVRNEF
ncbi:MAG: 4-hydroxy-3-methylbut-2-enyl diphosphate reductase [Lachnospiraceae bacterium]|nr:4-hydroxy-3-methylbut-2-enyl diphosphate reductase [Lachnospiraceae bacterium]